MKRARGIQRLFPGTMHTKRGCTMRRQDSNTQLIQETGTGSSSPWTPWKRKHDQTYKTVMLVAQHECIHQSIHRNMLTMHSSSNEDTAGPHADKRTTGVTMAALLSGLQMTNGRQILLSCPHR